MQSESDANAAIAARCVGVSHPHLLPAAAADAADAIIAVSCVSPQSALTNDVRLGPELEALREEQALATSTHEKDQKNLESSTAAVAALEVRVSALEEEKSEQAKVIELAKQVRECMGEKSENLRGESAQRTRGCA